VSDPKKVRLFPFLITAFFSIKNHENFYYRELLLLKRHERSEVPFLLLILILGVKGAKPPLQGH
jgi:hypothetical protein